MEIKEYFEKVMQDYNQHRNGRSLRKYCKDEVVDYSWLLDFKNNYPVPESDTSASSNAGFIPLLVNRPPVAKWEVDKLLLNSPAGDTLGKRSVNAVFFFSFLFVPSPRIKKDRTNGNKRQ